MLIKSHESGIAANESLHELFGNAVHHWTSRMPDFDRDVWRLEKELSFGDAAAQYFQLFSDKYDGALVCLSTSQSQPTSLQTKLREHRIKRAGFELDSTVGNLAIFSSSNSESCRNYPVQPSAFLIVSERPAWETLDLESDGRRVLQFWAEHEMFVPDANFIEKICKQAIMYFCVDYDNVTDAVVVSRKIS